MRALTACLAFVLSIGLLANVSNANITVTRTNTTAGTFNGSTGGTLSGTRSVTFENGVFGGHPTAEIISIEVEIAFAKLNQSGSFNAPFFNEIEMIFSTPSVSTVLIDDMANPFGGDADAFTSGLFVNSGGGYDGVVRFSSLATQRVNFDRGVIPNSSVQTFTPAGVDTWTSFVGQSANNQTFTLSLADRDPANDASLDPLIFRSMTVTITAVPEPSTFGLCGLLTLGGALVRRRSRA